MDILDILREDYRNFPKNQTYSIYAEDVYFKDPMNEFRGRDRYRQMIQFLDTLFIAPQLDLHEIQRQGNQVRLDWTLNLTSPLPWKPRLHIPGWTELTLNAQNVIVSHVDHWNCSRLDVLKQNFRVGNGR
jgi:hypothetical protein